MSIRRRKFGARSGAIAEIPGMRHFTSLLLALLGLAACRSADPRLAPALPDIDASDIVFVGESHEVRDHQDLERATLEAMQGRHKLLLGMEMFQRPYQQPLDDYVAGRIDEKEMLRRTEYFSRWAYNYTYYAPMWRWCRAHGARVVALNAEASVNRKVGRQGLAALTPEERAQVAAEIDLTNAVHRERVMGMFTGGAHQMPQDALQKMYEAMTVWDETMAESAATAFAAAGAGARMIVVAGRGHIEGLTGIPDRVMRRLPGLRRTVLVADMDDEVETPRTEFEDGQWVCVFPAAEKEPPPKLGVSFDLTPNARGMLVQAVVEGGTAAIAGIVEGDLIESLDGEPVRDLTDLRYVLDTRSVGDLATIGYVRGGESRTVQAVLFAAPAPPAPPAAPPKP